MNEPIRYAVIGVGGVGRLHGTIIRELDGFDLVAVVDRNGETAERVAADLGCEALTSLSETARRGVEAVSVAVPPATHLEIGLASFENGWHVMMEKPLEVTGRRARQLVDAAESRGLVLAVAHQYRLHGWAQTVKRLIDEGAIGEPLHVVWSLSDFRSDAYFDGPEWKSDTGHPVSGILSNQAAHALDVMMWMLGAPQEVSAMTDRQLHRKGGDDIVMAQVRFRSGCLMSLTWSINAARGIGLRQFVGTKGMILMTNVRSVTFDARDEIRLVRYGVDLRNGVTLLRGYEQPTLELDESGFQRIRRLAGRHLMNRLGLRRPGIDQSAPHRELLVRFGSAIRGSGRPIVSGKHGLRVVELIEAIAASAAQKKHAVA